MVAETKLGFFYLLNVNTMTKYQVGGEGGGGVGRELGWEIEKHLQLDYLNFSSSQLKSSIGRNGTNSV